MNEKFMDVMLTFASKVSNNRLLSCIRDAFTDLMPVIIIGSFCTLFANVVCNTTPGYMSLANVPGLAWLGMFKPLFTDANYGTMNMMAIGIVIMLSAKVAESYGNKDKVVSILALSCFISLCVTSATAVGFCGTMVVNAPWTTPPGLMAFMASGGSFGAVITQLLCVVISFAIYTPFVILANKQQEAK